MVGRKEISGQATWLDLGLADLRTLGPAFRSKPVEELPAAASLDDAVELLVATLDIVNNPIKSTPCGDVQITRKCLRHIVEKRSDERERLALYALDTLTHPFEVWEVEYSESEHRKAYIGAYTEKGRQMLVIVAYRDGQILWNYMHSDAKSMNKHRHGNLLYSRLGTITSDFPSPLAD